MFSILKHVLCKGLIHSRRIILQIVLVIKLSVTLGIGTIDRLSIGIVPQMLPEEVPFKAVTIAESLFTVL